MSARSAQWSPASGQLSARKKHLRGHSAHLFAPGGQLFSTPTKPATPAHNCPLFPNNCPELPHNCSPVPHNCPSPPHHCFPTPPPSFSWIKNVRPFRTIVRPRRTSVRKVRAPVFPPRDAFLTNPDTFCPLRWPGRPSQRLFRLPPPELTAHPADCAPRRARASGFPGRVAEMLETANARELLENGGTFHDPPVV